MPNSSGRWASNASTVGIVRSGSGREAVGMVRSRGSFAAARDRAGAPPRAPSRADTLLTARRRAARLRPLGPRRERDRRRGRLDRLRSLRPAIGGRPATRPDDALISVAADQLLDP